MRSYGPQSGPDVWTPQCLEYDISAGGPSWSMAQFMFEHALDNELKGVRRSMVARLSSMLSRPRRAWNACGILAIAMLSSALRSNSSVRFIDIRHAASVRP
jgi:hypothetical protein